MGTLTQPITNFISQNHSPCRNKHHFRGNYVSPCDEITISKTLHCAHKGNSYGPKQSKSLIESLYQFGLINETEEKKLTQFTDRMLTRSLETDVAITTASMHLREAGKTTTYCLNLLGLQSFAELETMTLDELEELAGRKQIEINRGLVALKFTVQNIANDIKNGNMDSAKERMQRFITRWMPS